MTQIFEDLEKFEFAAQSKMRRNIALSIAESILPIFEQKFPEDNRLKSALEKSKEVKNWYDKYAIKAINDDVKVVVNEVAEIACGNTEYSAAYAAAKAIEKATYTVSNLKETLRYAEAAASNSAQVQNVDDAKSKINKKFEEIVKAEIESQK